MTAIAFAETMCDSISLYGFANGSCPSARCHGGKSGRRGFATAGHHGLVGLHLTAWGCSLHS